MKSNPSFKYIVQLGIPKAVGGANTVEDLQEYLSKPHPNHRLVSCQFIGGNFLIVWERAETT